MVSINAFLRPRPSQLSFFVSQNDQCIVLQVQRDFASHRSFQNRHCIVSTLLPMRKEGPILPRFAVQQEYMHQSAAWQALRFGEERSELVRREPILKQVALMMPVGVNGRSKQRGYWSLLTHWIPPMFQYTLCRKDTTPHLIVSLSGFLISTENIIIRARFIAPTIWAP
jgi:hypothetical protein